MLDGGHDLSLLLKKYRSILVVDVDLILEHSSIVLCLLKFDLVLGLDLFDLLWDIRGEALELLEFSILPFDAFHVVLDGLFVLGKIPNGVVKFLFGFHKISLGSSNEPLLLLLLAHKLFLFLLSQKDGLDLLVSLLFDACLELIESSLFFLLLFSCNFLKLGDAQTLDDLHFVCSVWSLVVSIEDCSSPSLKLFHLDIMISSRKLNGWANFCSWTMESSIVDNLLAINPHD